MGKRLPEVASKLIARTGNVVGTRSIVAKPGADSGLGAEGGPVGGISSEVDGFTTVNVCSESKSARPLGATKPQEKLR